MRLAYFFFLALGAGTSVASGCVSDQPTQPTDAGPDVDPTGTEGHACFGNGTCNAGLTCISKVCVNLDSGTDAGSEAASDSAVQDVVAVDGVVLDLQCTGLSACSTQNQICCGNLQVSGGGTPLKGCGGVLLSSQCAAADACAPGDIFNAAACNGSTTVIPCEHSSDCTDPQANQCCTCPLAGDASVSLCGTTPIASFCGGTCQPAVQDASAD